MAVEDPTPFQTWLLVLNHMSQTFFLLPRHSVDGILSMERLSAFEFFEFKGLLFFFFLNHSFSNAENIFQSVHMSKTGETSSFSKTI